MLKSRRVDRQVRDGSGCVRGSERISRTSPEPTPGRFRAWAFFVPRRLARRALTLAEADPPSISLDMEGLFPSVSQERTRTGMQSQGSFVCVAITP